MRCALVLLRIFLGVIFAVAVRPKLMAGPAFAGILRGFLTNVGMQNAHPFYQSIIANILLPHVDVVAVLVMIAETCVAVALITGTATRLAGVMAMFLVTNYMFSKGLWWWNPSSNDGADFMIALALVIGAAGRTWGVDGLLAKRWPRVPLW
jgi:uncharacterized membrane protein YphA (DoxX/SURF4 family)